MSRREARIHTSIWENPDWVSLHRSEQHAYLVLLSQKQCSLAGVVCFDMARYGALCSQQTGRAFGRAVAGLERNRFIVCDKRTREILIRTFVKHDGVLSSPNAIVAMSRDFERIHSPALRDAFLAELGEGFLEGLPEGIRARLAEGFRDAFRDRFPEPRVRAESPRLQDSITPNPTTQGAPPPAPHQDASLRKPNPRSNGTNPRTTGANPRNRRAEAHREQIPEWTPDPELIGERPDPSAVADLRATLRGDQ